jgi:hypothetical protein
MPHPVLSGSHRFQVLLGLGCLAAVVMMLLAIFSCGDDAATDNGGCAEGTLACDDVCCPGDATVYACNPDGATNNEKCQLISCNDGLYLCGPGCIPISANCCSQDTGEYCQTGSACCGAGCMPVGSACCENGNYCPAGSVCCSGGTQCC